MTSVIHSVSTRGNPTGSSIWVTSYRLSHSLDNTVWTDVLDPATGDVMTFPGNTDENTPQDNSLPEPVLTRSVKLHPLSYNYYVSLRWAVRGCFKGLVYCYYYQLCLPTCSATDRTSHCDPQHSRKMYEHSQTSRPVNSHPYPVVCTIIKIVCMYVVIAQKILQIGQ